MKKQKGNERGYISDFTIYGYDPLSIRRTRRDFSYANITTNIPIKDFAGPLLHQFAVPLTALVILAEPVLRTSRRASEASFSVL